MPWNTKRVNPMKSSKKLFFPGFRRLLPIKIPHQKNLICLPKGHATQERFGPNNKRSGIFREHKKSPQPIEIQGFQRSARNRIGIFTVKNSEIDLKTPVFQGQTVKRKTVGIKRFQRFPGFVAQIGFEPMTLRV